MVEVRFDTDSLSGVRFAVSPLFEATLSIGALSAPASAAVHLPWLAQLMRDYWELALADHWPRIKSLLEDDILYRARKITDAGTRALFPDLDPSISWTDDGVLRIDKRDCDMSALHLDDRGLLLLPSAFAWPKVVVVSAEPWQPTVIYPARGVGMLWQPERPVPPDALAR